jgi:hypothetical protein
MVEIQVVNSLGQILYRTETNVERSNNITIDVSNYASGLYFVNIKADGVMATKKLLVE